MSNDHHLAVVSVGTLPDLLKLREEILRSAGYNVHTATSLQDGLRYIRSGECGVLLICYSTPDEWRRKFITTFREVCPSGQIVGITNYPVVRRAREIDDLVYGIEGPETLLRAVSRKSKR